MDIYQDLADLKEQIRRAIETQDQKSIASLLKESFALCEKMKQILQTSGEEERKQLAQAMQQFRLFLDAENQRLSKKMGLSEEQFIRYGENPDNFSKEQWKGMQLIRHKFAEKTKEIKQTIRTHVPPKKKADALKEALPENWRELIAQNPNIVSIHPPIPPLTPKKKPLLRKVKKSKWLKS